MKIYLFLLSLVICSIANAQWTANTSLNLELAAQEVSDLQSVATSDGKTWIAYYHANGGNYDMRAQLLDVNGNKLLGANGLLVSNQTSGSATFVFNVCKDIFDNLIIAYQYEVSGTMKAAVAKVNTDGTLPWGSGVILGDGLAPYPAITKTNEVIVCWNNNSPSTLYTQKISNTGVLMWSTPVSITVGTSNTTRGQIVCHSNGDYTVVFQRKSFGISTTLYARRFTESGVPLWAGPVQLCNQTTSAARYYSIIANGNTTYYGYYAALGSRFFSFLQKINADGTLPWGINGALFSTFSTGADPMPQTTRIAHDNTSAYIWAVATYSNPSQTEYGVFAQKFDTTSGAVQLNPVGKQIYAVSPNFDTQAGELSLVNDGPLFINYDVNYKIYATRLDNSGNFVWPSQRVELSSTATTLANPKGRFAFSGILNGQGVAVWTENRGIQERAYVQNIPTNGVLPVRLLSFSGERKNNAVKLTWRVSQEINCDGYQIEKSEDGNTFVSIGFIKSQALGGNSTSSMDYVFSDDAANKNNLYYRLKINDLDGRFQYSKVIYVNTVGMRNDIISIFPNPTAGDFFTATIYTEKNKSGRIDIFDAQGKSCLSGVRNFFAGINNFTTDISGIASGIYFIRISYADGTSAQSSFIKK
jgi:hypothetical protein